MKTPSLSTPLILLGLVVLWPSPTWAGTYMPQAMGMYDTIYELRYGVDCRGCHGSDLATRHHNLGYTCVSCHTQKAKEVDDCLDCHDGHDPGGHHSSDLAASWQCMACHGSAFIEPYPFEDLPAYPLSDTTPRPYRCKVCHNSSPNPPGPGDPDPTLVGIDGASTANNTHHNTRGAVYNATTCNHCHDSALPHTEPIQIRYCERCHSPDTLHSIGPHWAEEHCAACHADTVVIQILDVWTSNWKGRPQKGFTPGDKIRLNVKFRVIGNPDVQYKVRLWGEAFSVPDRDWELPLDEKRLKCYPSESIKKWKETVPIDAVPETDAKVWVRMKVVDVGMTPYFKAKFQIK
jgi:hypothetical protein